MAQFTVRNVEEEVKTSLKQRAARHGCSLEEEVRRILRAAATHAATLAAERQRAGRPVDLRDTLIAGIALAQRATLATRNRRPFEGLTVPVVDPWDDPA